MTLQRYDELCGALAVLLIIVGIALNFLIVAAIPHKKARPDVAAESGGPE